MINGWDNWSNEFAGNFNSHLRLKPRKTKDGKDGGEIVQLKQNIARPAKDIHSFSYIHLVMLMTFSKLTNW